MPPYQVANGRARKKEKMATKLKVSYEVGQELDCKVNYSERDGYAVIVIADGHPGFIKCAKKLNPGDEIKGLFVSVHNARILLTAPAS